MNTNQVSTKVLNTFTCLPEKFIVDFANSIDVTKDHLRSFHAQSFGSRLFNTFTGKNALRQQSIDLHIIESLDASLTWLSKISESVAKSNLALTKVNDRINSLMQDTAKIATFSAETRKQLYDFVDKTANHVHNLNARLTQVELRQEGLVQLEEIMVRWQVGDFNNLSIAGRCYAALEELRWGAFGDLLRLSPNDKVDGLINMLQNKAMIQMARDLNVNTTQRLDTNHWLTIPKQSCMDEPTALAYLADWSTPNNHPIIYSVTQANDTLPLQMPRLCSSERLVSSMVNEVFEATN